MQYYLFSALLIAVDQLSKKWVETKLEVGQEVEIVKGKFYLSHLQNKGAAYGMLSNHPRILGFLTTVSLLNIINKFRLIFKNGEGDAGYRFSLACILGGAIGNIIDRVKKRYVTDFLYIAVGKNAPVFNIADLAVLVGALVFIMKQFKFLIKIFLK